jgi:tRNA threonylcarbamoyladenosine biosynthesis protein TsaE
VQTPDEFVELGFETYVHGDGLTCIEWAGRVADLLPADAVPLEFHHVAPSTRRVTLGAPDSSSSEDDR